MLCIWVLCLYTWYMHLSVCHVHASGSQKRHLDPLELELLMNVSHRMDVGTEP